MKTASSYRTTTVWWVVAASILLASSGLVAKADFTFGQPVNLGARVNSSSGDALDFVSYDGLEMYFDSRRSGGYGNWDIWVSTRETIDDDWGEPVNLGPTINTSQGDSFAFISADGLELYFSSYNRPGGYGNHDIWVSKRETIDDDWGEPENLGLPVNSSSMDSGPFLTADGLELYFYSQRSGGYGSDDIWVTRRATKDHPWETPVNLGPIVNSSASESSPFLSYDGLLLLFSEDYYGPFRSGGLGNVDMWISRRMSISDPWGTPVNLGPRVNTSSLDGGPRISPDGSILYFASERPGGYGGVWGDTYQSAIIPIVDFNGDGKVDGCEVCLMADRWGTDDTLYDIGPMPWGDGVVDVEDLKVLARHIGQSVDDPTLVAHWKLDESEGMTAYDSAGVTDGTVMGVPVWQPDGGKVGGALEFDGTTFVVAGSVLDPSDGPFSVLAWVKGGAPGQVLISQVSGVNWLMADELSGTLMTELRAPTRDNQRLVSETVITDGDWHRVAFVWDGVSRMLYVDDVLVASDTQSSLGGCAGSLIFGRSSAMAPGTSWTGLIDDVRIYNRAVRP